MLDVTFGGALLAGLISFISPCVLPLVPPYLCYLAGISFEELAEGSSAETGRKLLISALAFVLGFTTVFVGMGATASVIGQSIAQHFATLSLIAGVIIIIMGLHFLGLFKIGFLYREARVQVERKPAGIVGAYLIGLAFAFGWTPCVGPVLAAILFMAGTEETAGQGAFMLLFYSLGLGIPFVAAAAFATRFLSFAQRFRRHLPTVEKVMGGMLVVTGVLFMTGHMASIAFWLLETFPAFQYVG
ncbi:MAG: cytochrome c biogenesis protein CcdA [Pseudomonadota bacterium]